MKRRIIPLASLSNPLKMTILPVYVPPQNESGCVDRNSKVEKRVEYVY